MRALNWRAYFDNISYPTTRMNKTNNFQETITPAYSFKSASLDMGKAMYDGEVLQDFWKD